MKSFILLSKENQDAVYQTAKTIHSLETNFTHSEMGEFAKQVSSKLPFLCDWTTVKRYLQVQYCTTMTIELI